MDTHNKPRPLVFLNGEFMPLEQATIPVLDRGFLFGDAIYEVVPAYHRKLFRLESHLERLADGLRKVEIDNPYSTNEWTELMTQLINANDVDNACVYLQVTRGVAPQRDHAFPKEPIKPLVFGMCQKLLPRSPNLLANGLTLELAEDTRWSHCNIKSTSLLANVLHRQAAAQAGVKEVILHRDGIVTEGAASTILMAKNHTLFYPPQDSHVLPGTTRRLVAELADKHAITHRAEHFTVDQLFTADEVMLSSVSNEIMPVCKIGQTSIGKGEPGPLWKQLDQAFQEYKHRVCVDDRSA